MHQIRQGAKGASSGPGLETARVELTWVQHQVDYPAHAAYGCGALGPRLRLAAQPLREKRFHIQGVISAYDPSNGFGMVVRDTDGIGIELAPDALEGSVLRFVRQGQRVNFVLDTKGRATQLRFGSEADMITHTPRPR